MTDRVRLVVYVLQSAVRDAALCLRQDSVQVLRMVLASFVKGASRLWEARQNHRRRCASVQAGYP